jgi:hypothetical protein
LTRLSSVHVAHLTPTTIVPRSGVMHRHLALHTGTKSSWSTSHLSAEVVETTALWNSLLDIALKLVKN